MAVSGQLDAPGHCTKGKWLKLVRSIGEGNSLLPYRNSYSGRLTRTLLATVTTLPVLVLRHRMSTKSLQVGKQPTFPPSPAITHCSGDNVTRTSERCLQFHEKGSTVGFSQKQINSFFFYCFFSYSNKRQTGSTVLFICSFHCYDCSFSGYVDTLCFSGPAML